MLCYLNSSMKGKYMAKICLNPADLTEDEKRLIAFYRSQPPRVQEFIMNLTRFEKGLPDAECAPEAAADGKCAGE